MNLKIKDWEKFQHFKDRKPPWIKLYREILDDIEWHELDPVDAKLLVMLWLLASEEKGTLPSVKKIAYRFRVSEKQVKSTLSKLSHWLVQDDIKTISDRYQDDPLETEEETETYSTETEHKEGMPNHDDFFDVWWKHFPKHRKGAKGPAKKKYIGLVKSGKATVVELWEGLVRYNGAGYDKSQYAKGAFAWLSAEYWTIESFPIPGDIGGKIEPTSDDLTEKRRAAILKSIGPSGEVAGDDDDDPPGTPGGSENPTPSPHKPSGTSFDPTELEGSRGSNGQTDELHSDVGPTDERGATSGDAGNLQGSVVGLTGGSVDGGGEPDNKTPQIPRSTEAGGDTGQCDRETSTAETVADTGAERTPLDRFDVPDIPKFCQRVRA